MNSVEKFVAVQVLSEPLGVLSPAAGLCTAAEELAASLAARGIELARARRAAVRAAGRLARATFDYGFAAQPGFAGRAPGAGEPLSLSDLLGSLVRPVAFGVCGVSHANHLP
jgi:hypothetical protein